MSSHESPTHKWLRQNIQPYANRDAVYAHVNAALARHPTVRPKTDVYTYDDGRTQLLLCLHGLLPITYRGASYNIPIAIWLTRDYPRQPPIVYVVPTNEMLVRASPDVDVSGRCQIEYLRNWEKKSEGCNLVALVDAMQECFSRVPPVYAKPARVSSPQSVSIRPQVTGPDYSGRPPPPVPGGPTPPTVSPSPTAVHSGDRPPLPAKPGTSAPVPYPTVSNVPMQSNNRHDTLSLPRNASLALRPPPPLPPHPPIASGVSSLAGSPVPPTYTPHANGISAIHDATPQSARSFSAPATSGQPSNQPFPAPIPQQSMYSMLTPTSEPPPIPPATHPMSPARQAGPQHPPYSLPVSPAGNARLNTPPPPLPPPFVSPQPTANFQPQPYYAPQPAPPPPSALTAAYSAAAASRPPPAPFIPPPDLLDNDDPSAPQAAASPPPSTAAPPRPPNPELLRLHSQVHGKLQSELASLQQAMALDAERLRAHQADLLAGEPAIRDEMARLEAVRDVCRTVADRMRAVVDAGTRNVAELRRKGDPEVDELVCSTTIVHNQLINLVAEDNAIEDTIYHLHRALNTGRIDLERFIRTTRVLAEEQFMKRALIDKIQAGLPRDDADIARSMASEWK